MPLASVATGLTGLGLAIFAGVLACLNPTAAFVWLLTTLLFTWIRR